MNFEQQQAGIKQFSVDEVILILHGKMVEALT